MYAMNCNDPNYGTELDRTHCPFYLKIGACRHGERCSRAHVAPETSPTVLLSHFYQDPNLRAQELRVLGHKIAELDQKQVEQDL